MWLLVGLGNPEQQYENTRHNIGFRVLDSLSTDFKLQKKIQGEISKIKIGDEDIILLKPTTYMNLSGNAVSLALSYYNIESTHLIVVYDDIDHVFGKIRIAKKGGSGGHNGVQHIIDQLGTNEFTRIRIGIQSQTHPQKAEQFVLKPFSKEEEQQISKVIEQTKNAITQILTNGIDSAMNTFHEKDSAL